MISDLMLRDASPEFLELAQDGAERCFRFRHTENDEWEYYRLVERVPHIAAWTVLPMEMAR